MPPQVGETISADQLRRLRQQTQSPQLPRVGETISAEQFRALQATEIPPERMEPRGRQFLRGAQNVLGGIFGGDILGEAIGAQIARRSPAGRELARQEREGIAPRGTTAETFQAPTGREIAGDIARTGLLFTPVGRGGQAVTSALRGVGLRRGTGILGQTVAGGGTGAAFDIAEDVAEGRELGLGGGTIVGGGLPIAARGIGLAGRIVGRVGSETGGALTGTSAETLEQAFEVSRRGGPELESFTRALRGQTTPEGLVNSLRDNIAEVVTQRGERFSRSLQPIANREVPTRTAKDAFRRSLGQFGITVDRIEEGGRTIERLNFDKSALRLVPNARTRIEQAFTEVNNLPTRIELGDLDTTRQALKVLRLAGDSPSENRANRLLDDAVRSVREAGENVEGYGRLLDEFGETSEFLEELQRGVSAGDRNTIDQTYRRLATTLRTNNEQRMALVRELDEATEGAILSRVAGQQLSELFPRGIFRQIVAGLTFGGVAVGGVAPSLLAPLVFASPRVTGEVVRALGIGKRRADELIRAISAARTVLIRSGVIIESETSQ